ncbi:MAG: hypothetical protein JXB38_02040 [Anaerolineales bacterium]|nr:hypothetical protein [Anaerolineales bacterium]
MHVRKVPQPGWNLEYVMFIFMRISGLLFFLLALTAVALALYMGARYQMDLGTLMRWTFFPNPNHVVDSNIPDLEAGWSTGFWQVMQILFLFFGGTHGMNGLRVVLEDYIKRPYLAMAIRTLFFLLWIFLLVLSVYVVLGS